MSIHRPLHLTRKMLEDHMRWHIEKAGELAIYALRYPVKGITIKQFEDQPKQLLTYTHEDGTVDILYKIELRQNPLHSTTIDTYVGGELADLVPYKKM